MLSLVIRGEMRDMTSVKVVSQSPPLTHRANLQGGQHRGRQQCILGVDGDRIQTSSLKEAGLLVSLSNYIMVHSYVQSGRI
jgi:hypothetical protein